MVFARYAIVEPIMPIAVSQVQNYAGSQIKRQLLKVLLMLTRDLFACTTNRTFQLTQSVARVSRRYVSLLYLKK